jgi:ketosteroid isomerase-like protein
MSFPTPLAAAEACVDARNAEDVDALLAAYEPGALVVVQPGTVLPADEGAHAVIESWKQSKPTLTTLNREILQAGATALHLMRWRLEATGPDGEALDLTGCTADILGRQPDGGWLVSIDNPYGTDIA